MFHCLNTVDVCGKAVSSQMLDDSLFCQTSLILNWISEPELGERKKDQITVKTVWNVVFFLLCEAINYSNVGRTIVKRVQ